MKIKTAYLNILAAACSAGAVFTLVVGSRWLVPLGLTGAVLGGTSSGIELVESKKRRKNEFKQKAELDIKSKIIRDEELRLEQQARELQRQQKQIKVDQIRLDQELSAIADKLAQLDDRESQLNQTGLKLSELDALLKSRQSEIDTVFSTIDQTKIEAQNYLAETREKFKVNSIIREELQKIEDGLKEKSAHLDEQLHLVYHERAKLLQFKADLDNREVTLNDQLDSIKEQQWQYLVNQANEKLQAWIVEARKPLVEWHSQLQEKEAVVNQAIAKAAAEWEAKFGQLQNEYQEKLNQTIAECNQKVDEANQKINSANEYWSNHYKRIYSMVASREIQQNRIFKKPDYPEGKTNEDLLSRQIIDKLHRVHGIVAKEPYAQKTNNGFDLYFKPLECRVKPVHQIEDTEEKRKFVEQMLTLGQICDYINKQAVLDLQDIVPAGKRGSSVKSFVAGNGKIRLEFNTNTLSLVEAEAVNEFSNIKEPKTGYLAEVIQVSNHIKLSGFSQSGKSTLANNIVGLYEAKAKREGKKITFVGIDPKPITEWDIPMKYEGLDQAIAGLVELDEEIDRRLNSVRSQRKEGVSRQQIQKHLKDNPFICLIDEVDDIIAEYDNSDDAADILEDLKVSGKKPASKRIKRGLKVGAAIGVILIIIGQSPLAGDLNFKKNDLNHPTNIYIGYKTIPTGIEQCVFSREEASELILQMHLRKIKEEEQEKQGITPDRYALFALNTGKTFLATLPRPSELVEKEAALVSIPIIDSPETEEETDSNQEVIARLTKSYKLTQSTDNLGSFNVPETPCSCEGSITQIERDWVKYLWHIKQIRNKRGISKEVYGVGSPSSKKWQAVQERLKIINEQEGLGLKWD